MFKVIEVLDRNTFRCHALSSSRFDTSHADLPDLKWSLVGVFRDEGVDDREEHVISRNKVLGKVLRPQGFLIKLKKEWLNASGRS